MIEKNFDVPFVSGMALREKQIQQNYRPIIAVHKWFARRPGTLFRALLLAEFVSGSLRDRYFESHNLKGIQIADPFMGGGTPLLEANRIGCDVVGYDINPMAYWIVKQEIEHLNLTTYRQVSEELLCWLEKNIGDLYRTRCHKCGSGEAQVKYFLWVKTQKCCECRREFDLFPGYLLAQDRRHPKNVFVCSKCGELNELPDRRNLGKCHSCGSQLRHSGPARRNQCICSYCQTTNRYPNTKIGAPKHRMFAIEYYCRQCKFDHQGRFFKKPDGNDLAKVSKAEGMWSKLKKGFTPKDEIPHGDETGRLHRWGYRYYREMFNLRQLLGLELSCQHVAQVKEDRVRSALATNLSDLLRYQNMLCRYDTMALKSLDIFSVHGFPVGLVQCESNLLGIRNGQGTVVGSGGWVNIIEKYWKAKAYCENPFEVKREGTKEILIPLKEEWIGDKRDGLLENEIRKVKIYCQSAGFAELPPASIDAVFTDPPYLGNVQYAELMDFCYVWLRRLVGATAQAFHRLSTRDANELTANFSMERGVIHFTLGISEVFSKMAVALKPGAPLAFTYHHNSLDAYYPIAVAILDSRLTCSASIPCPAEMGASIHINGTGSSVVDTIFVCRSKGMVPAWLITKTPKQIADLVRRDIAHLRTGTVTPTLGDIRCLIHGHLIRLAIWYLKDSWNRKISVEEKLRTIAVKIHEMGGVKSVEQHLKEDFLSIPKTQKAIIREEVAFYRARQNEISF